MEHAGLGWCMLACSNASNGRHKCAFLLQCMTQLSRRPGIISVVSVNHGPEASPLSSPARSERHPLGDRASAVWPPAGGTAHHARRGGEASAGYASDDSISGQLLDNGVASDDSISGQLLDNGVLVVTRPQHHDLARSAERTRATSNSVACS